MGTTALHHKRLSDLPCIVDTTTSKRPCYAHGYPLWRVPWPRCEAAASSGFACIRIKVQFSTMITHMKTCECATRPCSTARGQLRKPVELRHGHHSGSWHSQSCHHQA